MSILHQASRQRTVWVMPTCCELTSLLLQHHPRKTAKNICSFSRPYFIFQISCTWLKLSAKDDIISVGAHFTLSLLAIKPIFNFVSFSVLWILVLLMSICRREVGCFQVYFFEDWQGENRFSGNTLFTWRFFPLNEINFCTSIK